MPDDCHEQGREFLRASHNKYKGPLPEALPEPPAGSEIVDLPEPQDRGGMPLWGALRKRRSRRRFGGKALELETLSQLLWAAHGLSRRTTGRPLRTAPSAGAQYPADLYVVVHSVTGIRPGLYKYDEMEHRLLPRSQGDVRPAFREACMGQEMVSDAQALFIWVAVRKRMGDRYAARAYRYLFLDIGHAAENLALAAESLLLGCCSIGAYYDEYTDAIMGLDGEKETVSYMTVVGRKR